MMKSKCLSTRNRNGLPPLRALTLEEVRVYKQPKIWFENHYGKNMICVIPLDTNAVQALWSHPNALNSTRYGITWQCWAEDPLAYPLENGVEKA